MVQVLEQQGDVFGRIGKGLGKGLADQLPKEVERYRLSSGLKKLKDSPGDTTLDRYINLYSTPGVTPEMANQLEPHLRQASIREKGPITKGNAPVRNTNQNSLQQAVSPSVNQPQSQDQQVSTPGQLRNIDGGNAKVPNKTQAKTVEQDYDKRFNSITNVADINRVAPPLRTQEEKEIAAFDNWENNPGRFQSLDQAIQYEEQKDADNFKVFEAKATKRLNDLKLEEDTEKKFNESLKKGLQKTNDADTFGDIPGEIQQTILQKAKDRVNEGSVTPEKAGQDAAAEALTFAKQRQTLKTLGSNSIGKAPDQLIKDLKRARENYEKYGALKVFVEDMKAFNDLGDHLASTIAFPLSEKLNKVIPARAPVKTVRKSAVENLVKEIGSNITKDDSIFSIGLALNEAGFDDVQIIEALSNNPDIPLNQRQLDEIVKYTPLSFSLGDIFLSNITDLWKSGKVSAHEKTRRTFWGKR